MPAKKEDFGIVAKSLVEKWSKRPDWSSRSKDERGIEIGEDLLKTALETLGGSPLLKVAKLFSDDKTALAAKAISVAEDAIRAFQQKYSTGTVDGVFGLATLKAMRELKACGHASASRKKNLDPDSVPSVLNASRNKNRIFFHVATETFKDSAVAADVEDLVTDAWNLWQVHADFKIDREAEEDANVVINMRPLGDGIGGMLGLAHIGGPDINQKLECSLDSAENWNPHKFRTALCHELGHILGLSHSQQSGQLMSPFLTSGIDEPKTEDILRIQAKWGKSKEAEKGPVRIKPEDRDKIPGMPDW